MFRPRSHSSDSPTPILRAPDVSLQSPTKRGHSSAPTISSTSACDLDDLRRKRRRRDNSQPMARSSSPRQTPNSWVGQQSSSMVHSANPEQRLATTSAQFNFFPAGNSSLEPRRSQTSEPLSPRHQERQVNDLIRLRSTAFWELRQSIAENGEGLVRRMRDYEHSRSRHRVHQKAKEAEKRGRKRLPLRSKPMPAVPVNASNFSDSEEEEVVICSDDSSNNILLASISAQRARSLDAMDVDGSLTEHEQSQHTRSKSPRSSPDTIYTSGSSLCHSDEDDCIVFSESQSHIDTAQSRTSSSPSLSHSTSQSPASSSVASLPLQSSEAIPLSATASSSEKAIAALNLALANGAGSINDYSPIWTYQEPFNHSESYDSGELWQ